MQLPYSDTILLFWAVGKLGCYIFVENLGTKVERY